MALDLTKVFKGIQQVKALPANPEKGVIYFVREHVDGNPTGNASVYFGGRLYGNVEATRLAKIESDILALDGRVDAIEAALGTFVKVSDDLNTVAKVVAKHEERLNGHDTDIATANTNASDAVATASTAKTTAEEAKRIAEGAVTDVTEQVEAAQAAQAKAEAAQGLAETAKAGAVEAQLAAEAAKKAAEDSNTSATAIATKAAEDAAKAMEDAAAALDSVKDGVNFKGVVGVKPETTEGYNVGDIIIVGEEEYIAGEEGWILLGNINPAIEQITTEIEKLDATVEDKSKKVTVTIVETDGKLTSVTVDDTAMVNYVDAAVSAIDHRVYYGGDDAE